MHAYPQMSVRSPGPVLLVLGLLAGAAGAWVFRDWWLLSAGGPPLTLIAGFIAIAAVIAAATVRNLQAVVTVAAFSALATISALVVGRIAGGGDAAIGSELMVLVIVLPFATRLAFYQLHTSKAQVQRELELTSRGRIVNRRYIVSDGARAGRTPIGRAMGAAIIACLGLGVLGGLPSWADSAAIHSAAAILMLWIGASLVGPALLSAWLPAMPDKAPPPSYGLGPLGKLIMQNARQLLIAAVVVLAAAAVGMSRLPGAELSAALRAVLAGSVALIGMAIWLVSPRLALLAMIAPLLASAAFLGALGWLGIARDELTLILLVVVFLGTLADSTFWFRLWSTHGRLNHLPPEEATDITLRFGGRAVLSTCVTGVLAVALLYVVDASSAVPAVLVAAGVTLVASVAVVPAILRLVVIKLPANISKADIALAKRRNSHKVIEIDRSRTKLRQYSPKELSTMASWDFYTLLGITSLRHAGTAGTRRILYEMDLKPGDKVLQVGLGTANYAKFMIEEYGVEVYGVDYEPYMVEKAMAQAEKDGIADKVHFICGDVTTLPYKDNTFDAAISESFLYGVSHGLCLPEIYRVLKPGGRLGCGEWAWTHVPPRDLRMLNCSVACGFERPGMEHFYTREGWIELFKGYGYEVPFMMLEPFIWFSWPGMTDNEGGAWSVMKIFYRALSYAGARNRFLEIVMYLGRYEGWMTTTVWVGRKPLGKVFRVIDQPLPPESAEEEEERQKLRSQLAAAPSSAEESIQEATG